MNGLNTIVILIFLGLAADIADFIAFRMFLSQHDIGWFAAIPLSLAWEYLQTPIGLTLTILGFAPWIFMFGYLHWEQRRLSKI